MEKPSKMDDLRVPPSHPSLQCANIMSPFKAYPSLDVSAIDPTIIEPLLPI